MAVKQHLNAAYSKLGKLVDGLSQSGIPDKATDIYQGRNRVVRLDTSEAGPINIKEFRRPHLINRVIYGNIRQSKARRAYLNACRLLEMGFLTPQPIAWVEVTSNRLMSLSYLVTRQEDTLRDVRDLAVNPLRLRLIDAIGMLMAQLHSQGVWMKDFSAGNILWHVDHVTDQIQLFLVDINRMKFNVHSRNRLMNNFRSISNDEAVLEQLAQAYSIHSSIPYEKVIAQANTARRRFALRQRLKHPFRSLRS